MLLFLAGIVEQLDLSLEHIGKGDLHNSRFGLMLTDNALELILHEIVKDKRMESQSWRYRENTYPHEKILRKAFLGSFSDKLMFARIAARMDTKIERTFNILHEYRNELYHAGLSHNHILPSLAMFYFHATCTFLSGYDPRGLGWGSGQKMPDRAKKYFKGHRSFPGKIEDFAEACQTMSAACGFEASELIHFLADDLDRIIEHMDVCLQIVADGVYEGQKTSRDEAILGTQAWELAFNDDGRAFGVKHGFSGNQLGLVDFLIEKYPFRYRCDPVPSWRAQARKIGALTDPHEALDRYHSFVKRSGNLRAAVEQSAAAAEAEIEAQIDRMRGK